MPTISRFLGIVIAIYYNDHPPGHFHAKYGEFEALVNIQDGTVEGHLPGRALRLVREWYEAHQEELSQNWILAQERRPMNQIEPVE